MGTDRRVVPFFVMSVTLPFHFTTAIGRIFAQCSMIDPVKWKRRREKEIDDAVWSQLSRREREPVHSIHEYTHGSFVSPCLFSPLASRIILETRLSYKERIRRPASLTLIT